MHAACVKSELQGSHGLALKNRIMQVAKQSFTSRPSTTIIGWPNQKLEIRPYARKGLNEDIIACALRAAIVAYKQAQIFSLRCSIAVSCLGSSLMSGSSISNRLRGYYVFPAAGFVAFPEHLRAYAGADSLAAPADLRPTTEAVTLLTGGPKTPITQDVDVSEPASGSTNHRGDNHHKDSASGAALNWKVFSSTFGVRFNAAPMALQPMPPLGIEIIIPDQSEWPAELWRSLNAPDSVHMRDSRIASLGITQHLCAALEYWAGRMPNFGTACRNWPFYSSLVASKVTVRPEDMQFQLRLNESLPERLMSITTLSHLWDIDTGLMPPAIRLEDLTFESHLSQDLVLVKATRQGIQPSIKGAYWSDDELLVFKPGAKSPGTYTTRSRRYSRSHLTVR